MIKWKTAWIKGSTWRLCFGAWNRLSRVCQREVGRGQMPNTYGVWEGRAKGCTRCSVSLGSGPASHLDHSLYLPCLSFHSCEQKLLVWWSSKVSSSPGRVSVLQLCHTQRRHQWVFTILQSPGGNTPHRQRKGRRHQDGRGDSFYSRQSAWGPPSCVSMHFILLTRKPCLRSTSTPFHNHQHSYHQQSILRFVVCEMLFPRRFQGNLACTWQPALEHAPSSHAREVNIPAN